MTYDSGHCRFTTPLPFAIFLLHTIGAQRKFVLFSAVVRDDFASARHNVGLPHPYTGYTLDAHIAHAFKGGDFYVILRFEITA